MAFSVIVPIAKGDEAWRNLLQDLLALEAEDEIVFVSTHSLIEQIQSEAAFAALRCPCHFVVSEPGRARQLNAGAKRASRSIFWFLHCDSRMPKASIDALQVSLKREPESLHFFDLKFQDDGPSMVRVNGVGAWIRSRVLRLPFGDQGFCASRATFETLGGFDESARYGEDHLFVWRAHQAGVKVRAIGAPLYTSARKYRNFGWGKTTMHHLHLTAKQALPEFFRFLRKRVLT